MEAPFVTPQEDTAEEAIEAIRDELEIFDDWMERYQYIIEMGRKLPPFPKEWCDDAQHECKPPAGAHGTHLHETYSERYYQHQKHILEHAAEREYRKNEKYASLGSVLELIGCIQDEA